MEAFLKESNRVKGTEVLFFEDAEIEKIRSDSTIFAASGPMSVLYFKDYNRYVLQINDWRYPLLRRLRVISNSDANDMTSKSYFMPAMNGYTFNLKINKIHNPVSIQNFETILASNSDFTVAGLESPRRKVEASPDDKLVRKATKDTGAKEILTEKAHSFMNKMKVKAATMKTGTKYLTSTKKRIDMSKIKNKNFRKNAKSTIKSGFFLDNQYMKNEFIRLRDENNNMLMPMDIATLNKTTSAPAHFIVREDIEETILNYKELAENGAYNIIFEKTMPRKKSFVDEMRYDLEHIKDNFGAKKEELKERIRNNDAKIEEKMHVLESHHHYEA